MVTHTQKFKRRYSIALLPATTTLAVRLFKETWGLLLITLCGMVACVGLVCAVPLLSQVAIQTGIQEILKQSPTGIMLTDVVVSDHPTTTQIQQAGQTIDKFLQAKFASYLGGSAQVSLSTPKLQLLDTQTNQALANQYVSVYGFNPPQLSQQFTVLKGRLPQEHPVANEIEIAVTQPVANKFGWQVGTTQQVRYPIAAGSAVWHLHVVGIVAVQSSAGNIWESAYGSNTDMDAGIDTNNATNDIVASLPAILPQVSAIQIVQLNTSVGNVNRPPTTTGTMAQAQPATALTSTTLVQKAPSRELEFSNPSSGGPNSGAQFMLYWNYPLNLTHINSSNLGRFLIQYNSLFEPFYNLVQDRHVLTQYLQWPGSPIIVQLQSYQNRIPFEEIVNILLLISILGLALYMVSILSNVLIERQLSTIVMLRSRGATLRHIFGAFTLHGLFIGLLALLLGPVCAIVLVGAVEQRLLPATALSSYSTVAGDLGHSIQQIGIFALLTVVIALIVMLVSLRRATLIDMVTMRQSVSRSQRAPLWKRLYLDFFLLAIIGVGIAYNQILFQSGAGTRITLAPLAFIAVPLLSFACVLLFLRIFPFLARIGTRLATKSKPAPGVLAFAQIERQPHAALRMILLLALALSSSIYLLSFIATQQSRIQQIAAYQTGADFSGPITVTNPQQTLKDLQSHYSSLPGVISATMGYQADISMTEIPPAYLPTVIATGVDADTYAQTAVWSSSYTSQSLQPLTAQLVSQRTSAIAQNEVYAIVAANLWNALNLHPGKKFTLPTSNKSFQNIQFVAIVEANTLPTPSADDASMNGNMLFDYQNYAAVYAKNNQGAQIQPNYVLLHTYSDAHSLSQVRHALPTLLDQRAIIAQAETLPLPIGIEGTLILGLIVSFVLALIGVSVAAWLSVKQRRLGFTVLRALGMPAGQIAQILLWEQGVVYISALLIGLSIGWLSTMTVIPAFALIDSYFTVNGIDVNSINLPIQKNASLPFTWLVWMLGIFVVICGVVLLIMARYGSRSAMSQMLRLNED